ncbi:MAG: hypothetical protein V8R49_08075 [Duodenibacillus massiliensis]
MRRFFDYAFIPAALFILWLYTTTEGFVAPILLPSPASVAARFAELIGNGELLHHIGASAFRTMTGFLLAASRHRPRGALCQKPEGLAPDALSHRSAQGNAALIADSSSDFVARD